MVGKLSLRYIRRYPILQRVGEVAYRLELSPELPRVHNVFYVSQLRKYIPNPSHVIEPDPVQLQEDLAYEEELIHILDRREKQLIKKIISLMKVLWANHKISKATWEPEQEIRSKYPHLVDESGVCEVSRMKLPLREVECKTLEISLIINIHSFNVGWSRGLVLSDC